MFFVPKCTKIIVIFHFLRADIISVQLFLDICYVGHPFHVPPLTFRRHNVTMNHKKVYYYHVWRLL